LAKVRGFFSGERCGARATRRRRAKKNPRRDRRGSVSRRRRASGGERGFQRHGEGLDVGGGLRFRGA
jgi:hypothetical protein